jgi:hypothetical protein
MAEHQSLSLATRLEDGSAGIPADILSDLEMTENAAALRMRLTLRDTFAIEVGHLLDQIVIVQNDWAIRTDG